MNLYSTKFHVRKCVVCGYEFSDLHHAYPHSRGGQTTYKLCPNHHRFANMLQAFMYQNLPREDILKFANENFDDDFNGLILKDLMTDYKVEARWHEGRIDTPSIEEFFDGIKHEWNDEQLNPQD